MSGATELRPLQAGGGLQRGPAVGWWLLPSAVSMAWLVWEAKWFWLNRPDLHFGWIVLALSLYLLWEQWETRPPLQVQGRVSLVLVGLTGLAGMTLFQLYRMAFGTTAAAIWFLALGCLLVSAANLGCVFGKRGIRSFLLPMAFLFLALPLPSLFYTSVVTFLQSKVAATTVELLNVMGVPARQVGNIIQLPTGAVGVDEACSGIRSLQSTLMATIFIGYLTLRRASLMILLVLAGVLLALLGNLVRSLILSYSASRGGSQAVTNLHDTAGWMILVFTVAGVSALAFGAVQLERKWKRIRDERAAKPAR